MRGGLERWKRGVDSGGVRQAVAYAFDGTCDSHTAAPRGTDALAGYSAGASVTRLAVEAGQIREDALDPTSLRRWVNGEDPATGERRGRDLQSPDADLILDGTINAPKSFSLASLIYPELAAEFEALQDRLRDRIVVTWHRELNARRGAGGSIREGLQRIEVVELRHRRSRALDPHIHRHLWLNVKVLGMDGKWSNVDSRVAMKLHTVINAEGEIAARTDPEWTAALARHGYTLDEHGEIAQVAHAVRPMSRRSNQIETNRHAKMAEWRAAHPGQEPSHDVLAAIDRWAWAQGRPNGSRRCRGPDAAHFHGTHDGRESAGGVARAWPGSDHGAGRYRAGHKAADRVVRPDRLVGADSWRTLTELTTGQAHGTRCSPRGTGITPRGRLPMPRPKRVGLCRPTET